MFYKNWQYYLDEEGGAGASPSDDKAGKPEEKAEDAKAGAAGNKKSPSLTAEEQLLAGLSDEQKKLYADALNGTKSALDAERGLNKDAKAKLKRLEEYEAAEEKRKTAEMSELEKAQKATKDALDAATKAQEELYNTRVRAAIEKHAVALGFVNPDDAYNLADLSGIEIGEDGKVSGAKEVLEALAKAKPYLVKVALGQGTPKSGEKQKVNQGDEKPAPVGMRF